MKSKWTSEQPSGVDLGDVRPSPLHDFILASGYTLMVIQTATFAEGAWWFGCYGKPKLLLRANAAFQLTGKWECDASLGIVSAGDGRLLIGRNTLTKGVGQKGRVVLARPDEDKGLVFE